MRSLCTLYIAAALIYSYRGGDISFLLKQCCGRSLIPAYYTLEAGCLVGSYILASNIVEFNIPAYLGLYPSFLVLWSQSISSWLLPPIIGGFTSSFRYLIIVLPKYQFAPQQSI